MACRHINFVGPNYLITTTVNNRVDVHKRGVEVVHKQLDIEYMRYSILHNRTLFIGSEEKQLYMLSWPSFTILAKITTQSFIFTMAVEEFEGEIYLIAG